MWIYSFTNTEASTSSLTPGFWHLCQEPQVCSWEGLFLIPLFLWSMSLFSVSIMVTMVLYCSLLSDISVTPEFLFLSGFLRLFSIFYDLISTF